MVPDLFLCHIGVVVSGFYTVTDNLLKRTFVQFSGNLRRKRIIAVQQEFSDKAGHNRTVKPAGNIKANRYIRNQTSGDGFFQKLPKAFHVICLSFVLLFRMVDHIPVFDILRRLSRQNLQHMSACQRVDSVKKSDRRDDARKIHQLIYCFQVQLSGHSRIFQNGLDLRGKQHSSIHDGIEQRRDADMISDQQQLMIFLIVQRNGKLAVQTVHKICPVLLVQMKNNLHVRPGPKGMPFQQQFLLQILIVKNFSVADHGYGPVFVLKRLHPSIQIEKAQTVKSKRRLFKHQHLAPVRSPVPDLLKHPA